MIWTMEKGQMKNHFKTHNTTLKNEVKFEIESKQQRVFMKFL